jgi:hypothetical protein
MNVINNSNFLKQQDKPPVMPGAHSGENIDEMQTDESAAAIPSKLPVFTSGAHVPIDYPLQYITDIAFLRALAHHKVAISAPKEWFPGVPLNTEGVVTVHPYKALKLGKKDTRLAMAWVSLDHSSFSSPHSSVVQSSGKFQMEARGPTSTGLQRSVAKAIRLSKLNASILRDFSVKEH